MVDLHAQGITLKIDGKNILQNIDLQFKSGELTIIIGPNGAGKTSLLRLLAGIYVPNAGATTLDGANLAKLPALHRARQIGYLPQSQDVAWPLLARDVVALGRFAYGAGPDRLSPADASAVDAAMTSSGCAHIANRAMPGLSGGESARVHLARLLAGETAIILADEPIAALDPRHQRDTLALLQARAHEGAAVVLVLHDLSLAAHYADRLIWMQHGAISADGAPAQTMTFDNLAAVFSLTGEECAAMGLV